MAEEIFKTPKLIVEQPLSGKSLADFITQFSTLKEGWYISGAESVPGQVDAFHVLYKKLPEQCCG